MSGLLNVLERRVADQRAVAIKQHDLDGDIAAVDNPLRSHLRRARDLVAERDTFGLREHECFSGIIRRHDARAKVRGAARGLGKTCQPRAVDFAALGVKIGETLRKLGHFADAAGDSEPRHRMAAQIFEHPANEIAHVDQRNVGKAVKLLCGGLGAGAGGADDMSKTRSARNIDAAMNRVDPCGTGIRHDDSRGAEN